jgi:hypothetical protein
VVGFVLSGGASLGAVEVYWTPRSLQRLLPHTH